MTPVISIAGMDGGSYAFLGRHSRTSAGLRARRDTIIRSLILPQNILTITLTFIGTGWAGEARWILFFRTRDMAPKPPFVSHLCFRIESARSLRRSYLSSRHTGLVCTHLGTSWRPSLSEIALGVLRWLRVFCTTRKRPFARFIAGSRESITRRSGR